MVHYILQTKALEDELVKISDFLEKELGLIKSKNKFNESQSEYNNIGNVFFFHSEIHEEKFKEVLDKNLKKDSNIEYVLINLDKRIISYSIYLNKTAKKYGLTFDY